MSTLFKQAFFRNKQDSLYEEGITQHEEIQIRENHFLHPDIIINQKIEELSAKLEAQIKDIKVSEKGPYISKLYGALREEAFLEFEKLTHGHLEHKRNEYIKMFYQNVDVKYQHLFKKLLRLRQIYRQNVLDKEFRLIDLVIQEAYDDTYIQQDNIDGAVDLLKKDVIELSIDWYLVIEKIVDILVRCQLYKIKKGSIYRDIVKRINLRWWNNEKLSLQGRMSSSLNFSLKNIFKKKKATSCAQMPYDEAMDASDIFVLITWTACGDTLSKLFKQLRQEATSKDLLVRIKGFLLLTTQALSTVSNSLNEQFENCLAYKNYKELHGKQQVLDNFIDELINFRENTSVFDSNFLNGKPTRSRADSIEYKRNGFEKNCFKDINIHRMASEAQEKIPKGKNILRALSARSFHSSGCESLN